MYEDGYTSKLERVRAYCEAVLVKHKDNPFSGLREEVHMENILEILEDKNNDNTN
jgi:hypothetical protein